MTTKPDWKSLQDGHVSPRPDVVAEPVHRVGPEGVSSGISFRELPEPSFEQVKRICKHYVRKCSGKYESNIMAARYVHQLAEEVLSMLSGIANEIQTHQEVSKITKHRFEEWEKNFPVVLREIGGPEDIANYLKEKDVEIRRLQTELAAEREMKDIDLKNIMRSMDYQLHASRCGALNERQQLTQEVEVVRQQYKDEIEQKETKLRQEMSRLHAQYHSQMNDMTKTYEMETSQLKEEHNKRVKALTDENKRIASNAEKEIEMLSQHRDEMRAKIVKLQKQMNSQTGNYESDSDASSDGGTLTLPTTTLSGSIEAMKAEEKRRLSKKYRKKVTKLLRQLESAKASIVERDAKIDSLLRQSEDRAEEIENCYKKLAYQREINEYLREHLEEKLEL